MLILSIDIGLKNLAHCLLQHQETTMQIIDWGVVDLTDAPKCHRCVKAASYRMAHGAYCKKHVPVLPKLQGLLKPELEALCATHGLPDGSRSDMATRLAAYKKKDVIKQCNTVEIGRALAATYARFPFVDVVLVENQMAARMAVVQGMVIQYWVMRDAPIIEVVSPANKLKGLLDGKTTYAQRKKFSVAHTREILVTKNLSTIEFDAHKKKDDLADTFLQAMWYINNLKKIKKKME
jgi:hypothetical protein